MEEQEPQRIDQDTALFYQSGVRYKLIDGCDRVLYAFAAGGSVLLVWCWRSVWSVFVALLFFWQARKWLRILGKADPLAVKIYLGNLLQEGYIAARAKYSDLISWAKLRRMPVPRSWRFDV